MDYGKLAYLKAEELENRLGAQTAVKKTTTVLKRSPNLSISGKTTLACYEGGQCAVIVKARIKADGGKIDLFVSSMKTGNALLNAGENEVVMLASCPLSEGEIILDAHAAYNAVLVKFEILLIGDGAGLTTTEQAHRMDFKNGIYGLIGSDEQDVDLIKCDSRFESKYTFPVGRGDCCDVCVLDEGFYAVYCDIFGKMWGVSIDPVLNETGRMFLGEAKQGLSVAGGGDKIMIAYLEEGKIKGFVTKFNGKARSDAFDIPFSGNVEKICFVKGAAEPALAVESGKKIFLLRSEDELAAQETFNVFIEGRLSGV